MPFIKDDLEQVQESKPVPEGEYDLTIKKAEEKDSKKGNPMIEVVITIDDPDYPNATPIFHYLNHPEGAKDDQTAQLFMLDIKRFCHCFDVPYDFEAGDLPGSKGTCFVKQVEGDDDQIRNELRLPRVND